MPPDVLKTKRGERQDAKAAEESLESRCERRVAESADVGDAGGTRWLAIHDRCVVAFILKMCG